MTRDHDASRGLGVPDSGAGSEALDQRNLVGRRVGRVRVDALIGIGGMGEVYLGFDETLERRVALKAIRPEFSLAPETKDRFLREARILSRLDHPNICRLYDLVEEPDGDVLILELVEGTTLGERPEKELSPAERLRIAREIALALASAHREGVVHRDLKPENVMVRPDGVVKVLDFGIARSAAPRPPSQRLRTATEPDPSAPGMPDDGTSTLMLDSENTQVLPPETDVSATRDPDLTIRGTILGTLRFMSPEQAAGDPATPASDIFSLGLVLQWLWTGRSAYGSDLSHLRLLKKIRWAETEPFASGDAELDGLVEQCKSLDPRDRPTAEEAASRLAWIAGRAERTRRRWRLGGAAAGIALLAVAGSLAISAGYQDRRLGICRGGEERLAEIWNPDRERAVRASFAASGLPFAAPTFDRVAASISGWGRGWTDMRRDACEATHVRGEQSSELLDLRMACLDRRLQELHALLDVFENADSDVVERASSAVAELGNLSYCADRELLATPVPRPSDPAVGARLSEIEDLLARGNALLDAGKYGEALEEARKAVELADEVGYRPLQAEALYLRGSAEEWIGEFETSESTLQKAAEAALAGLHDEILVRSLGDLVWVVGNDQADLEGARPWAGLAFAKLERMDSQGELAAALHNNFGSALMTAGRWDEARGHLERALEIRSRVFGEEHLKTAGVLGNLANLAYARGGYEESVELNRRAMSIYEEQLSPGHPRLALVLGNLGSSLYYLGRFDECAEVNERAYDITLATYGPDNPNLGFYLVNLGQVALAREDWDGALSRFRRADELFETAFPPGHPVFALSQAGIGTALLAAGSATAAIPPLERALASSTAEATAPAERAAALFALARAYWQTDRRQRAHDLAREARDSLDDTSQGSLSATIEGWLTANGLSS